MIDVNYSFHNAFSMMMVTCVSFSLNFHSGLCSARMHQRDAAFDLYSTLWIHNTEAIPSNALNRFLRVIL